MNKKHGCDFVSTYEKSEDLKEHELICDYVSTTCNNVGCKETILMKNIQVHKKICQFESVRCKNCGGHFQRNKLQDHLCRDEELENSIVILSDNLNFLASRGC
jgi:hypothetical protein